MTKASNELVPMLEGTAQNQPCLYGELVEGHAVYCDNGKSPYRKCRCSWYYGRAASFIDGTADENCEYFSANPDYTEDKKALAQEIQQLKQEREVAQREFDNWTIEGWLCHRCMRGLPLKNKKVICSLDERRWQENKGIGILMLPDGTERDWVKSCDGFIPPMD